MNSYKKEEFGFDFVGTLQENLIHCPQRSHSSPRLIEICRDFKAYRVLEGLEKKKPVGERRKLSTNVDNRMVIEMEVDGKKEKSEFSVRRAVTSRAFLAVLNAVTGFWRILVSRPAIATQQMLVCPPPFEIRVV